MDVLHLRVFSFASSRAAQMAFPGPWPLIYIDDSTVSEKNAIDFLAVKMLTAALTGHTDISKTPTAIPKILVDEEFSVAALSVVFGHQRRSAFHRILRDTASVWQGGSLASKVRLPKGPGGCKHTEFRGWRVHCEPFSALGPART